jgi:hypothetical protein
VKKLVVVAAVAALFGVVPVGAAPVLLVPEPSGFVQLAAGLFVLGGLALVARKRVSRDEVE